MEYVLRGAAGGVHRRDKALRDRTVGVVGCGQIGGRLAPRLPSARHARAPVRPAARRGRRGQRAGHDFVRSRTVLAESDIVTLHTPLTRSGPHPTVHLIGADELAAMRADALLVNASRGAVVDNAALREALEAGAHRRGGARRVGGRADARHGAPAPHGARHAAYRGLLVRRQGARHGDALRRAHRLARRAGRVGRRLGARGSRDRSRRSARPPRTSGETAWLDALARQAYDLRADDARMRAASRPAGPRSGGAYFHRLRKTYPRRRAWEHHTDRGEPRAGGGTGPPSPKGLASRSR